MLEKGSELGAHILSGAVLEPRALDELLPDWQEQGAPLDTPVDRRPLPVPDRDRARSRCRRRRRCTTTATTSSAWAMSCRWLAQQAEALGVEIFPGFAAAEVLYDDDGRVKGVATGDMGIGKDGEPTDTSSPAWSCTRKYTLFAEGCRGSLAKQLIARFELRDGRRPADLRHRHQGTVGDRRPSSTSRAWSSTPSAGRSTGAPTAARSCTTWKNNQVAVGFVVGLDYQNPYLSPFEEFQRCKTHPAIRGTFEGGRRICLRRARDHRGRACSRSRKLVFPGRRADRLRRRLPERAQDQGHPRRDEVRHARGRGGVRRARRGRQRDELDAYPEALRSSGLQDELHRARNFKPGFRLGLCGGLAYDGARHLRAARQGAVDPAPPPRPRRSSSRRASARRSTTRSRTASSPSTGCPRCSSPTPTTRKTSRPPALKDPSGAGRAQPGRVRRPEQRYCPAGVYEFVRDGDGAAAPADQRAELRALQDLRHQGPDAEHRLGHAGGRRRAELRRHVSRPAARDSTCMERELR